MLIEFRCTNLTEYDAATGRSSACGERLVAPEEKIGEEIKCKKCGNNVEIPIESVMTKPESQRSPKSRRPSVAASKTKRKSTRKPGRRRKKTNESMLADPDGMPTDVMTFEFEAQNESRINSRMDRRCPKCAGGLSDGRCSKCRYVEKKFESSYLPLDKLELKPAGFQRYAGQIFNEGVSIHLILIGIGVIFGILGIVLLICASIVGGVLGVMMMIGVVLAATLGIGWIYKGYSIARDPRSELAWFQKPVWNTVLALGRAMNWQAYDKRYKGRVIIDKRKAPIVDHQIPELDELTKCQVLDLEGTLVTDAGLRHLYGLENLHCLNVRKTKVTYEGVVRLQQSNPKMWIWS